MAEEELFQKRSVLLVEDDEEVASALLKRIGRLGLQVERAQNGTEALELLAKRGVDAVLSDINMPKMNGLEFLFELRRRGNEVPLVFLTGFTSEDYLKQALRLGAVDFLSKPWTDENLKEVILRTVEIGYRMRTLKDLPPERQETSRYIASLLRLAGNKVPSSDKS